MFDSPSDAADALRDYFDPPRIEILIDALIPSIGFASSQDFNTVYEEFLYEYQDYSAGQRQQLLGSPDPEQDDPRYDAVVWTEFGVQHLSREDWQTHRSSIMSKARDWRLLLQVDLADWMQSEFSTGTVFFLIRNDDLKTRNFDDVIAVYQQT